MLDEASICDQCWREQMKAGRKQEPAPQLGYYRSRRTFLITEDVKKEEGKKEGRHVEEVGISSSSFLCDSPQTTRGG